MKGRKKYKKKERKKKKKEEGNEKKQQKKKKKKSSSFYLLCAAEPSKMVSTNRLAEQVMPANLGWVRLVSSVQIIVVSKPPIGWSVRKRNNPGHFFFSEGGRAVGGVAHRWPINELVQIGLFSLSAGRKYYCLEGSSAFLLSV